MRNLFFNRLVFFGLIAFVFTACKKSPSFSVEGCVIGAEKKTLYLENVGTSKVTLLDSTQLKKGGNFTFKHLRPAGLNFYRLRLGGQFINFAIDSLETIIIQANATNFATGYSVAGSSDCSKIKEITLAQLKASEAYNQLQKTYKEKTISTDEYTQKLELVLNDYKALAKKYIYENPKSTAAYFALFQQVNGQMIFDPYNKEDYKALGAVATSWTLYYPETTRSKHLYSVAMQALKVIRGERPIEYSVQEANTHFNIVLPDVSGKQINLMETCKGKIVLLDFTASGMENSPLHNIELNNVYKKYHALGFEIYQISLDADEHLWKNGAVNLPWICVRDSESVYSQIALKYNVRDLPTGFILNKTGEIVKRLDSFKGLEKDVAGYL